MKTFLTFLILFSSTHVFAQTEGSQIKIAKWCVEKITDNSNKVTEIANAIKEESLKYYEKAPGIDYEDDHIITVAENLVESVNQMSKGQEIKDTELLFSLCRLKTIDEKSIANLIDHADDHLEYPMYNLSTHEVTTTGSR